MKRILIFQLKEFCYSSYIYFSNQIGKELTLAGYQVDYFHIGVDGALEDIENLLGNHYDAIMEFNSDLPRILMEDDSHYLDHFDAPFYDYILDHPLYHHDSLKQPLKNFHVICLDEDHKHYIEENYPHVQSVHVLPLTGEEHLPAATYSDRSIPLLFMGTYTPDHDVLNAIDASPAFLAKDTRHIIEMMMADASLTQEDAVRQLSLRSESLIEENFALHMQAYFLADTYMRAHTRKMLILALADAGLPLHIYGEDWDKLPELADTNTILHPGVPFEDSFAIMADSKIVLNIMPGFKAGAHDRIYSSMLNHCLCLTDSSTMLLDQFQSGRDLVFYDAANPKTLVTSAEEFIKKEDLAASIAATGYELAASKHTWSSRVHALIHILSPTM